MNKRATPPDHVVREMINYFSTRDYANLERKAAEVVAAYPDFPFAWKALSVARTLTGGDALPAARRAVELLPRDAEAQNNLAKALLDAGSVEEAYQACRTALEIDPANPLAMNNLGNVCRQLGRFDEARNAYQSALGQAPNFFDATFNLGNLLAEAGESEAAAAAFRAVANSVPAHPTAARLFARELQHLGRFQEAVAAMRAAANGPAVSADLLDEFARLLLDVGEHAPALAEAERAQALAPDHASAHNLRGVALMGLGRLSEASAAFERSIAVDATQAKVWMNLGNVWRDSLRPQEALAAYGRALDAEPASPELYSNLLLAFNYLGASAGLPVEAALASQNERATPLTTWPNDVDPERTLRIGLVSGDLREHPVGRFLVAPLAALKGRGVELFAYANHWRSDSVTDALRESVPHWRNIYGCPDDKVVEMIIADRIDILVDLAGHTEGGRLNVFARKPAPLQVAWFGYFASTGLTAIDYVIADPVVLPVAEESHFVERAWRLPDTYYGYTPPNVALEPGPLPAATAGNGRITFGCFNNAVKAGPEVLSCWAEILKALPEATLFLKSRHFSLPEVAATFTGRMAELGIGAERLRLEGADGFERYLAAYRELDIALDPFPFTGGATTADALWMGVPVLTLRGDRFISHQGETILRSVGLDDWIADDTAAYVALAQRHAHGVEALSHLRGGLRRRLLASPFADAPRFAGNLAAAWRGMWVEWCAEMDWRHGGHRAEERR